MIKIHKAGHGIILGTSLFLLASNILLWHLITQKSITVSTLIFSILLLAFVIRFFRKPLRICESDQNILVAPADGTVVAIEQTFEDEILKAECLQISIFMSIWNVHINWIPISGTLRYFKYHMGKFLIAKKPKSSCDNERTTLMIETKSGQKIVLRQIAGFVARRIETYTIDPDRKVEKGQELGFIKFGSRVDIFLPVQTKPLVKLGVKTIGCVTPIAQID
ncbi:MAG TPA: phosphatidylserine decarboxylase family protein [Salinivirgaceae bacterium]|nr:phosphatidylserine decarboxylase family protein [Salinivirgaceae bacterium]